MHRDRLPLSVTECSSDRFHLEMAPLSEGERFELTQRVSGIAPGQSGRQHSVAFAGQAVAADAGPRWTSGPAAERDQLAGSCERIGPRLRSAATAEGQRRSGGEQDEPVHTVPEPHWRKFGSLVRALGLICGAALLGACKPTPEIRRDFDDAAASRGKIAVAAAGCGACHRIPGIDWPRGSVGPSLAGFDEHGPIAGVLPNRPDVLAAFVRNAPALKPGSPMPAMPLTERQAHDVAAFLYGLDDA
jgi:cytochrome c1